MTFLNCCCKRNCALISVIAAVILGIAGALLQITGGITITVAFLWAALGVAAVYLVVLLAAATAGKAGDNFCLCSGLDTVLVGLLGTLLVATVLLVVGITATSVLSAILVGLLIAALTLVFAGSACLIRCLNGCNS